MISSCHEKMNNMIWHIFPLQRCLRVEHRPHGRQARDNTGEWVSGQGAGNTRDYARSGVLS